VKSNYHVPFIFSPTVKMTLKPSTFDDVTDKNKLAPFYGSRCHAMMPDNKHFRDL